MPVGDRIPPPPVDRQVEAVLGVLAPKPDIGPDEAVVLGLSPDIRVPIIRFDFEGRAITPTDAQIRALAEQIVVAVNTASGQEAGDESP